MLSIEWQLDVKVITHKNITASMRVTVVDVSFSIKIKAAVN